MKIEILTLFPKMFDGPFSESIIAKAKEQDLVDIKIHDLRDYTEDKHNKVDDKPYGGGPGMVIKIDVVYNALKDIKSKTTYNPSVIMLTPQGNLFNQKTARELSLIDHLILIAGHYEGFDHRIREHLVDIELSIGDYVLTGGEIPAMVITDAVVRLIPGVLGTEESLSEETHSVPGHIKYPVYTRPEEFNGWKVPDVLVSGDHKRISQWRSKKTRLMEKED